MAARKKTTPPEVPTLYRRPVPVRSPDVHAWQQAIDDIVASVLADDIIVEPFTFLRRADGLMAGIKRVRFPSIKKLKKREAAVRRALVDALPEAIKMYKSVEHLTEEKGCRCRAYCLLRVNAMHVAKMTGEDPYELDMGGRDMFDAYMMDRS